MRIFLIILGALLALLGFACGSASVAAYRSVGSDGYVEGGGRMTTATAAFVTDTATFEKVDDNAATKAGRVRLRISAESANGKPIFVAVGTEAAVSAFLANGSSAIVRDLDFGPFGYASVAQGGTRDLPTPESSLFVVSASGAGRQQIVWPVQAGKWRAIILNADGSAGVDVDARFAVRFPWVRGFAIAGMIVGGVLFLVGVLLIVLAARRKRPPTPPPAAVPAEPAASNEP